MSEEAEEAGNYVGVTEAVDGGGNDSQASSHASDDGAHMHDMSSGGASSGESETTRALDADIAVPSGLPKATTGSAKKKRRGGRKKKKSAGADTHTRFPSEDEEVFPLCCSTMMTGGRKSGMRRKAICVLLY